MFCKCGCGKTTPVSKRNRYDLGHVKGEHINYLKGHKRRGCPMPDRGDSWKKNISVACKGRKPWNYGKKWGENVLAKLRGKRDKMLGTNNPNWKGGIDVVIRGLRRERDYRHWKRAILQRDGCCVLCGTTEKLTADHIKSFTYYPDLRYKLENGRTLCWNCHKNTNNFGIKARKDSLCLSTT